ncbi:NUDIX domain-containing protein [Streptomyces sp. NPDC051597]|uniref:NUDIX domain-containing protein n=1 Tax=Streptomyces sp. NPDC051597 TaxID=3155049 RepID=UPI00341D60F9
MTPTGAPRWPGKTANRPQKGTTVSQRYTSCVDRRLLLTDTHGRIALGKRINTGWMDEHYHLPAGHLEFGEAVTAGAVRELAEETGAQATPRRAAPGPRHAPLHHRRPHRPVLPDHPPQLDQANTEPDKCAGWEFFTADALPDRIVPYTTTAPAHTATGVLYFQQGWENAR